MSGIKINDSIGKMFLISLVDYKASGLAWENNSDLCQIGVKSPASPLLIPILTAYISGVL